MRPVGRAVIALFPRRIDRANQFRVRGRSSCNFAPAHPAYLPSARLYSAEKSGRRGRASLTARFAGVALRREAEVGERTRAVEVHDEPDDLAVAHVEEAGRRSVCLKWQAA